MATESSIHEGPACRSFPNIHHNSQEQGFRRDETSSPSSHRLLGYRKNKAKAICANLLFFLVDKFSRIKVKSGQFGHILI